MTRRKVIIDTDPGIDDAIAIMALLQAEDVEVLGLTSVAGNKGLDHTTTNAARILTFMGQRAQVYPGADRNLQAIEAEEALLRDDEAGFVHGVSGLGNADLPYDTSLIAQQQAVSFILEQVRRYPGQVDIIALGPLTNLALAVREDPTAMRHVRQIHTMGGGVYRGNRSPVAEFNYWFDPHAVDLVFQELGPYLPIYMIGLDVTHQGIINMNDLTFMQLEGGELGQVIYDMMAVYIHQYWKQDHYLGGVIHDLMAVVGYLYPKIYSDVYHAHVRCVTDSELAYGQTIVDLHQAFMNKANAYVPMDADISQYKYYVMELLFGSTQAKLYQQAKS